MGGKLEDNDGFEDLSEFISVEDDPQMHVKFFRINKDLEIKEITKSIKDGHTIIFIDLKEVSDDPGTLRIFVNKLKRISDDYSITMKLYGSNWLLILPHQVSFHVGDE